MRSRQKQLLLIIICCVFFISGCTHIETQTKRKSDTGIAANEKISFILDRSIIKDVEEAQRSEKKLEKCLDKAAKKLDPPIQTISAESFRNIVFPGMDYLSVPSSPDSILTLLNSSEFKNRIKSSDLRYLVILQGESQTSPAECGGLGAPGGAVLVCSWNKNTRMSASVIDLIKGCCAGEVKTEASGTGWIALIQIILPIGFPAITEGPARNALAEQVTAFIAGNRQKQ